MSPSPPTLYLLPGASSLFPHILLRYCDVDFKPVITRPDDAKFTKINPKQLVPAFVLDGQVITENPAIAHAVNQLAPDRKILGQTNMEFLKVCEMMTWICAAIHAQAWGPW